MRDSKFVLDQIRQHGKVFSKDDDPKPKKHEIDYTTNLPYHPSVNKLNTENTIQRDRMKQSRPRTTSGIKPTRKSMMMRSNSNTHKSGRTSPFGGKLIPKYDNVPKQRAKTAQKRKSTATTTRKVDKLTTNKLPKKVKKQIIIDPETGTYHDSSRVKNGRLPSPMHKAKKSPQRSKSPTRSTSPIQRISRKRSGSIASAPQIPEESAESRMIKKIDSEARDVPSSISIKKNMQRTSIVNVHILDDEIASKKQVKFIPNSEIMKNSSTINIGLKDGAISKSDYIKIENLVEASLQHVKNTLPPSAYQRIKLHKMNEHLISHYTKLSKINSSFSHIDKALSEYESKRQATSDLDFVDLSDITDLITRDLLHREGMIKQTKEKVHTISKANKELTRQRATILNELRSWFSEHGLDVDALDLHDINRDMEQLIPKEDEPTTFSFHLDSMKGDVKTKKEKLNEIFEFYRKRKENHREQEREKYLRSFSDKFKAAERKMNGTLELEKKRGAEEKVELLLRKVIFLEEALEDKQIQYQARSNEMQIVKQSYKALDEVHHNLIERLQQPYIHQSLNTNLLFDDIPEPIAKKDDYFSEEDELENLLYQEDADDSEGEEVEQGNEKNDDEERKEYLDILCPSKDAKPYEIDEEQMANIKQHSTIVDPFIWYVKLDTDQTQYIETPHIDPEMHFDHYHPHRLSPTERKFYFHIRYLQNYIHRIEMSSMDSWDDDAIEVEKNQASLKSENKMLRKMSQAQEERLKSLEKKLKEQNNLITTQSNTIRRQSESSDALAAQLSQFNTMKQYDLDPDDIVEDTPAFELYENDPLETLIESGELQFEDMSVEQRQAWKQKNKLLLKHRKIIRSQIKERKERTAVEKQPLPRASISSDISVRTTGRDSSMSSRSTSPASRPSTPLHFSSSLVRPENEDILPDNPTPAQSGFFKLRRAIRKLAVKHLKKAKSKPKSSQFRAIHTLHSITNQLKKDRVQTSLYLPIIQACDIEDINLFYDSKNIDNIISASDDQFQKINQIDNMEKLKNICKLLSIDRTSIHSTLLLAHQSLRQFYDIITSLFNTKSTDNSFTETEFKQQFLSQTREVERGIFVNAIQKLISREKKLTSQTLATHTARRFKSAKEEISDHSDHALLSNDDENLKNNNPIDLTKSVIGFQVRLYNHFKKYFRHVKSKAIRAVELKLKSDKKSVYDFSPRRTPGTPYSPRALSSLNITRRSSSKKKRKGKKSKKTKKKDKKPLKRMLKHDRKMKRKWEDKQASIRQSQMEKQSSVYNLVEDLPDASETESTDLNLFSSRPTSSYSRPISGLSNPSRKSLGDRFAQISNRSSEPTITREEDGNLKLDNIEQSIPKMLRTNSKSSINIPSVSKRSSWRSSQRESVVSSSEENSSKGSRRTSKFSITRTGSFNIVRGGEI